MLNCNTKSVIILGMHKSGTSMVAGVLNIFGVNLGSEMSLEKHWENPFGYFENKKFVRLNDMILKNAGGSWQNPPETHQINSQKVKFHAKIKKLINKEKSELWGWKDPRTNLLIDLYLPFIENPYFLVCYRDMEIIANRLKERNGMSLEAGVRLVEYYNQRINIFFQEHQNLKRLDIYYEKFIETPEYWLKNIINFLEIQPTVTQYQNACNFISPKDKKDELSLRLKENANAEYMKNLFIKGLKRPWKLFSFIFNMLSK